MTKSLLTLFCLLVGGCYSFNSIRITDAVYPADIPKPIVPAAPVVAAPKKEIACPPFILPILPPTPPLPIAQLTKIGPKNADALDAVMRQHIDDLRLYITKIKQGIRTSHDDYITACYLYSGVKLEPATVTGN